MNPTSKETQIENTIRSYKDFSTRKESNIIFFNDEENNFLKKKFQEIIEKRPNCEKTEICFSNACRAAAYSFPLENQKTAKINLQQINTKEIKDFSLLKLFFDSLKKSENIIIIKINFTFDELALNNDIFHFFTHLNSNKIKLIEIKLFFAFPPDIRKSIEMQLDDKKQQIFFFQEFLDKNYFSKF